MNRGLDVEFASQVAEKLMLTDALGTHVRDELGISETFRAKPLQASIASALSFIIGSLVPIVIVLLVPTSNISKISSLLALLTLFVMGGIASYIGGASVIKGGLRVTFWGAMAIGLTAGVGQFFGTNFK